MREHTWSLVEVLHPRLKRHPSDWVYQHINVVAAVNKDLLLDLLNVYFKLRHRAKLVTKEVEGMLLQLRLRALKFFPHLPPFGVLPWQI